MSARKQLDPPDLEGYTFIDRLGSGGFSEVFLYERHFPRQKVAIKVMAEEALGSDGRERFTAEANVMASLSTHPYIVNIYQAAISPEGHPYIVMQYYPRPNFSVRARSERFSVAAVLRAGIQVASAVETAHRSEVLHRDIKPANILTSDFGQPGLTDFGIAVAADQRSIEAEGMSIPWSPPEVVAGSGLTDERADIYSLGATLYTLLAGRSPFEVPGGSNRSIDLIDRIRRARPAPLERADVPDSLWRLLLQSMNKDPDSRPGSAAEFARSLQVIEVEQRFDMTPFEVSEGHEPSPIGDPIDADAGSTRVKGMGVIESQAPAPSKPAGATSTNNEAFRPAETVTRTTMRPAASSGAAAPAAPRQDLIHHTPYVPSTEPAPPVMPVAGVGGSIASQMPVASTYAAAQPMALKKAKDKKVSGAVVGVGVGAGVLVALLIVGILALTGNLGGDGGGGGTTTTLLGKPAAVSDIQVVKTASTDATDNDYLVTWKSPAGVRSDDVLELTVNGKPTPDLPGDSIEATVESSTTRPCVVIIVKRKGVASDSASNLEDRC